MIVNCIGGGPSLKGFDFSRLRGYTIGANRAAVEANADCMVSIDSNFANKGHKVAEGFSGEVVLAVIKVFNEVPNATYLRRSRKEGLSHDPEELRGLESGSAAINLAMHKGATHINLLGYDMNGSSVQRFHDGYEWIPQASVPYESWARRYKGYLKDLNKRGITVTHYVGPEGSSVNCFPRKPLEDYT